MTFLVLLCAVCADIVKPNIPGESKKKKKKRAAARVSSALYHSYEGE